MGSSGFSSFHCLAARIYPLQLIHRNSGFTVNLGIFTSHFLVFLGFKKSPYKIDISEEQEKEYSESEKTLAEATSFALEQSKEKIKAQAEELAKVRSELDDAKAKAETAENKVKELEANSDSNLTAEQKRLIQAGIEHEAQAQNSVAGSVNNNGATAEQQHVNSVKRVADKYYRNRR